MNVSSVGSLQGNQHSVLKVNSGKSPLSKKKSSENSAAKNVEKQISLYKEQLAKLDANSSMSAEMKKLKKEQIENQISEAEKQLNMLQIEEQKKAMEEQKQKDSSSNSSKTKEEKFTEAMAFTAGKFNSIQSFKTTKAQLQFEATALETQISNDAASGYTSDYKMSELGKLNEGIARLDGAINSSIGNINTKMEDYTEEIKNIKDNKNDDNSEKSEDEENENQVNSETENLSVKKSLSQKYEENAFNNYKENDKNSFNEVK